jgi:hypothetical protein
VKSAIKSASVTGSSIIGNSWGKMQLRVIKHETQHQSRSDLLSEKQGNLALQRDHFHAMQDISLKHRFQYHRGCFVAV